MTDACCRALIYFLALQTMLDSFQRSLIYQPWKVDRLPSAAVEIQQAVTDVQISTADGLVLNGWLSLAGAKRGEAIHIELLSKRDRPLVIIFPGNGGHRGLRQYLLQILGSMDADTLIFDYRGFGDNPGKPTETHLAEDSRRVWNYATETLKIPPSRVVLYGESLGGAVATRLAAELTAEGIEPGGLVIQASFDSLAAAGRFHFPYLPVSLFLIDRYDSKRHISKVNCPILHLHGMRDSIVPFRLGQRLFGAAPPQSKAGVSKQFVALPNSDHNDVFGPDARIAVKAVQDFLKGVIDRHKKVSAQ